MTAQLESGLVTASSAGGGFLPALSLSCRDRVFNPQRMVSA
jgi:hypothetical protein